MSTVFQPLINIKWHTNLDDVMKYEKFPENLPYRPMVGDIVRSLTKRRLHSVEFEVCRCTITGVNEMEVEIHLVKSRWLNLSHWLHAYRYMSRDKPIQPYF